MKITLDLSRHCIETEIRRRRNRAISDYFKTGGTDARLESEIEMFDAALQELDFPALRNRHPALAGRENDRVDLLLAALGVGALGHGHGPSLSGVLLTGGTRPPENVLELVRKSRIPVILVDEDSYSAASAVHGLKVKIQPTDRMKIETAPRLVREHVDIARILDRL